MAVEAAGEQHARHGADRRQLTGIAAFASGAAALHRADFPGELAVGEIDRSDAARFGSASEAASDRKAALDDALALVRRSTLAKKEGA